MKPHITVAAHALLAECRFRRALTAAQEKRALTWAAAIQRLNDGADLIGVAALAEAIHYVKGDLHWLAKQDTEAGRRARDVKAALA